jgi:hypothetical protein
MGYDCLRTPPITRCRTSKQLELGRNDSICFEHLLDKHLVSNEAILEALMAYAKQTVCSHGAI